MGYEGNSKLFPHLTRPYLIISIALEYVKIGQDGIENTVLINRLTIITEEERPEMGLTAFSRTDGTDCPASEASTKTNPQAPTWLRKLSDMRNDLQRHNTLFAGTDIDLKMIRSSPLLILPIKFSWHTGVNYKTVTK